MADLDKKARSACNQIQQVSESLHVQNLPPIPLTEFLLSNRQRTELMTVLSNVTEFDLSLVVQELLRLPEVEDYCLVSPEEEKECQ